jgi:hypothetical protein
MPTLKLSHHYLVALLLLLPLSACAQAKKVQKADELPAVGSAMMSCRIEGQVVRILKPDARDKGTICAKYSCRARVKILNVGDCGAGVSVPLNAGDIITMRFAYTIHATRKLFPGMKVHFPGLKKGNRFAAHAEQRLAIGTAGEFMVTEYVIR